MPFTFPLTLGSERGDSEPTGLPFKRNHSLPRKYRQTGTDTPLREGAGASPSPVSPEERCSEEIQAEKPVPDPLGEPRSGVSHPHPHPCRCGGRRTVSSVLRSGRSGSGSRWSPAAAPPGSSSPSPPPPPPNLSLQPRNSLTKKEGWDTAERNKRWGKCPRHGIAHQAPGWLPALASHPVPNPFLIWVPAFHKMTVLMQSGAQPAFFEGSSEDSF